MMMIVVFSPNIAWNKTTFDPHLCLGPSSIQQRLLTEWRGPKMDSADIFLALLVWDELDTISTLQSPCIHQKEIKALQ